MTTPALSDDAIVAILSSLGAETGGGAVFHDLRKPVHRCNDRVCAFCAQALRQSATRDLCRHACLNAATNSLASGEPCFYRCWAGLLFVTVAVAPGGRCIGGISLGGFVAAGAGDDVAEVLSEWLSHFPRATIATLLRHVDSVRTIAPDALRGLGHYALEATFAGGLNAPAFFARQNAKYTQQREIAAAFADLKPGTLPAPPDLPYDAYRLLEHVARNDRERAMRELSAYLAKLLLVCHWDPIRLKAYLRVLLAVLTSQDLLAGVSWSEATHRELRHLGRLEGAQTTEDCCYEVAECIREHFGEHRYDDAGIAPMPQRVNAWLSRHYGEKATARQVARATGVSLSTLTHGLKAETGRSFRALRMETRLAEAKRLLATTGITIGEVAGLCGFVDQSHLTRCFKRAFTLTPRRFRALLHPTREQFLA